MNEAPTYNSRWQPMMLILDKRLDCQMCGAAAIFLTARIAEDDKHILEKADTWCFSCYRKHLDEDEE